MSKPAPIAPGERIKAYRKRKVAAGLCYEGGCETPAAKPGGRCEPHAERIRRRAADRIPTQKAR